MSPEHIRSLIAASPVPLDAAAVRRQMKGEFAIKPKQLPELAALLAGMDGLVAWPGSRYWTRTPQAVAEAKAIEVTEAAALPPKRVIAAITKGKLGYPKDHAEALIAELEEAGKLHRSPLLAEAKYKLKSKLTDADREYLERALRVIQRSLGRQPASPNPDEAILDALAYLEPQKGLVVTAPRLRNALPALSKKDFDAAVLRLYRAEKILLHRHSGPHTLPVSERDELIQSGDTYYVGVCWNTGDA